MKKVLAFVVIATIFFGCTFRLVDFTMISTKNIDLTKGASFQKGKSRIEGIDRVHIIIFIPIGRPDMKEAIDRAIEKIPGCIALLDGVIYSRSWYIPYIYGQQSYVVEGTPLIDPSLALNNDGLQFPDYSSIRIDNNGTVEVKQISEQDYLAYKERIIKDGSLKKFKNTQEIN